ncbi:MAG TPA: hypothetical protein VEX13_09965 [Chloroflexia bacterium]|nr:hypothetical protein [Chloroflexia bacterium]
MSDALDNVGNEESEAARQVRMKSLIARLNAVYPDAPGEDKPRSGTGRTLLLDTNAALFARWLNASARTTPKQKYHTPDGYYTIEQAHAPKRTEENEAEDNTLLTMNALFCEKEGGIIMHYQAIVFLVFPLADGRIAVQAKCNFPEVSAYFEELMAAIEVRWTK